MNPPWLYTMDLTEIRESADGALKPCTVYRWRDSSIYVKIRDEDNEIVGIWEE